MYGKMQESGLTEIIPFICISAIWGQHPVFFDIWSFLTIGSGCNLMAATSQVFFLIAFRAHQLIFSQFSSVQFSRSVASDSATPWTAACQACLSIASSRSLLKLMSIEFVMPPAISSSVIPFSFHLQYWRVAQLSLMTVTSLFTDMAGNNPFSHIWPVWCGSHSTAILEFGLTPWRSRLLTYVKRFSFSLFLYMKIFMVIILLL